MRYPVPAHAEARRNKAIAILGFVAQGYKIRSASSMVDIHPRTGEKYLDHLRFELEAQSIAHLVYIAIKKGIIN